MTLFVLLFYLVTKGPDAIIIIAVVVSVISNILNFVSVVRDDGK